MRLFRFSCMIDFIVVLLCNNLFLGLWFIFINMLSDYFVDIIALNKGDKTVFSSLYSHYWHQVYNFSRLYLTSQDAAEEVVQEVFVKVWESRETLRADTSFKGLLFIITRNLIFSKFRKEVNEDFYRMTVLKSVEESYTIEEEIEANDLKEYLKILINDLPPRCREVFILSRKENKSYKEIAELLSISEKTVENHISKALKILKENITMLSLFLFTVS